LRRKRVILLFKKFIFETLYVISDTELTLLELVQSDTFPQVALALKDLKEVLKKVLITGAIALWLLCGPLMNSAIALSIRC
jgi:hypothetical protein